MSVKENNLQNWRVAYSGVATYDNANPSVVTIALNNSLFEDDNILINNQSGLAQAPFISARTNSNTTGGAFTISAGVQTNTDVNYIVLRLQTY